MPTTPQVFPLDLQFQGVPGAIAAYLIPHPEGAVLVECGPGSTIPALVKGLEQHGYQPGDVTHLLLTHIHLDHAGAAGWLASQGTQVYVHPNGAAHLVNPEKLLASATRIYGEMMGPLWGEFQPVPEEKINILEDEAEVEIGELCFRTLNTPGHASHHNVYLLGDTVFSGDIGGIRLLEKRYLRLPLPPPDINLEAWRDSIHRIQNEKPGRIAPIHFGIYQDANWHLGEILHALDENEAWMEEVMPKDLPIEELRRLYTEWMYRHGKAAGISEELSNKYETADPSYMSADGLQRYWNKFRSQQGS